MTHPLQVIQDQHPKCRTCGHRVENRWGICEIQDGLWKPEQYCDLHTAFTEAGEEVEFDFNVEDRAYEYTIEEPDPLTCELNTYDRVRLNCGKLEAVVHKQESQTVYIIFEADPTGRTRSIPRSSLRLIRRAEGGE